MIQLFRLLGVSVVLAVLLGGISGCNTIAGLGEDIEAAGDAIEDEAEE